MATGEMKAGPETTGKCQRDIRCHHCDLPGGTPPEFKLSDGRSPDLRVFASQHLPGTQAKGHTQWFSLTSSPLTVAGAVTDLAPDGYTAPCSLFIRLAVRRRRNHLAGSLIVFRLAVNIA